jgi:hypothetical protein
MFRREQDRFSNLSPMPLRASEREIIHIVFRLPLAPRKRIRDRLESLSHSRSRTGFQPVPNAVAGFRT